LRLAHSLDHLIGAGEQRVGHGEAEHPGRLCVDDKFESSDRAEIEKWWPIIKGANIRAD
jgi:hypothetical protein